MLKTNTVYEIEVNGATNHVNSMPDNDHIKQLTQFNDARGWSWKITRKTTTYDYSAPTGKKFLFNDVILLSSPSKLI